MSDPTSPAERALHRVIDDLEPSYRQLLQTLVRIPSPIGQELAIQQEIERVMRSLGLSVDVFDIDRQALAGVPGFNPVARSYADRPCVVGTLKGSGGGRSLILNAHVDTAPIDPAGAWARPPLEGSIEDGRLYGRGAWDDKAGVVEILLVAEAIQKAGLKLRGNLILKSVVEDEATGNGTLACLARRHVADGAVIVDGTWPERFIVSHLGQLWFRITLTGRSAPASVAGRGANPLRAVGPIVRACDEWCAGQNAGASAWGPNPQPFFINLGSLTSGAWPGAVPSGGTITGQCGFAPLATPELIRAQLVDLIEGITRGGDWPDGVAAGITFDGLETPVVVGDAGNPVVRLLAGTVSRLRGAELQESIISGHCDLRHYQHWTPAIPACLHGPGGGKNAHAEDEYFLLEHLPLVSKTLASSVLEWCA